LNDEYIEGCLGLSERMCLLKVFALFLFKQMILFLHKNFPFV